MSKDRNLGTPRGSFLEGGRLSRGLINALRLISEEMSDNNIPIKSQAEKFAAAFKEVNKLPEVRIPLSPLFNPSEAASAITREPVDEYDAVAGLFGIELTREKRKVIVSR